MLDALYSSKILHYAGNIERLGVLPSAHARALKNSQICGSQVAVEICAEDKIVTEFAQKVQACALGQASCAIVAQSVIGASYDEIFEARSSLTALFSGQVTNVEGRFSELSILAPVKDHPNRHASCLLVLDCLVAAFEQLEGV